MKNKGFSSEFSNLPAIVRPMEHCLPLARATCGVPFLAVFFDLRDVALDRSPSLDLAGIFPRDPPSHVVPAVPLKPSARVVSENPSFALPYGEWLTRVYAEVIQFRIMSLFAQFRFLEPRCGKFFLAVRHVLPAEDAKFEHLFWGELGFEVRVKMFSHGFDELVPISVLHLIADDDDFLFHIMSAPGGYRAFAHRTSSASISACESPTDFS